MGRPVVMKSWYCIYYGAAGCLHPFLSVYYRRIGLNERQIGVLGALKPWASGLTAPLWAFAADRMGKHRLVVAMCMTAAFLTRVALMLGRQVSSHARMGYLGVMVVLMEIASGPISVIADAITLGNGDDYGKQRLWGAVGWGGFALIAGGAITALGTIDAAFALYVVMALLACVPTSHFDYRLLAVGVGASVSGDQAGKKGMLRGKAGEVSDIELAPILESVDPEGTHGGDHQALSTVAHRAAHHGRARDAGADSSGGEPSPHSLSTAPPSLLYALSRPPFLELVFLGTTWGIGVGVIESFLFLFLDELSSPAVLWGLTLFVTAVAEIPVFHFAMPILSWVGERPMIHVVFGAFTLRFLWYGLLGTRLLPSPWAVLPAELLHGITFACAWTVGCLIAKRCAPPGLSSTFQGIFQCIYFGIGLGIGSILGGWIYFYGNGARTVFRATCGIMLACWAAFAVYKHGLARAWGLST